jgi:hypothetical protein
MDRFTCSCQGIYSSSTYCTFKQYISSPKEHPFKVLGRAFIHCLIHRIWNAFLIALYLIRLYFLTSQKCLIVLLISIYILKPTYHTNNFTSWCYIITMDSNFHGKVQNLSTHLKVEHTNYKRKMKKVRISTIEKENNGISRKCRQWNKYRRQKLARWWCGYQLG